MKRKSPLLAALATLVVLAGAVAAAPPDQDDPFADSNRAGAQTARAPSPPAPGKEDDPFADANQARPPARATATAPQQKPARKDPTDRLIHFDVSVTPPGARPGQTVRVTITGKLKEGYHTYPLTERTALQDEQYGVCRLTYQPNSHLQPLWPVTESKPEFKYDKGSGGFLLEHEQPFTWSQDVLILPGAAGTETLQGTIKLQVCDASRCVQGEQPITIPVTVEQGSAVALSPELEKRRQVTQAPGPKVLPVPPELQASASTTAPGSEPARGDRGPSAGPSDTAAGPADEGSSRNAGLVGFVIQGLLWGFVSLLTPCVFPMIPITVSLFLKQSEKQHTRPWVMAAIYSLTIVVVLTIGGLLLTRSLQTISLHYGTNLFLGVLFLVFSLSLFGMYDITLPSGLANLTGARQGGGGLVGTIFMALTFTIISFACVGPFYGGFIALTATSVSAADWLKLSLGSLAFSTAFASPFFVLALSPGLLRSLPRSGSWMNSVKVVMGFIELAAALKFLRAAELSFFSRTNFLTFDLVLGAYVALALLCGLYLLNLYRLPHDHDAPEALGVPRLLISLAFITLALYLMPGLFKTDDGDPQKPRGRVYSWVESFLLPETPSPASAGTVTGTSQTDRARGSRHLPWIGSLDRGLELARTQHKRVFIDFTGFG